MNVAKFVMSSAIPDNPSSNSPAIATARRRSISASASASTACIASQNRRWSSAAAGNRTQRSAAALAHQSANASFERGATTRFAHASVR